MADPGGGAGGGADVMAALLTRKPVIMTRRPMPPARLPTTKTASCRRTILPRRKAKPASLPEMINSATASGGDGGAADAAADAIVRSGRVKMHHRHASTTSM